MRNRLYIFRHTQRLSQRGMAEKIGCSRATYSSIETGARDGTIKFWRKFQAAFDITDAGLGELMRVDEK